MTLLALADCPHSESFEGNRIQIPTELPKILIRSSLVRLFALEVYWVDLWPVRSLRVLSEEVLIQQAFLSFAVTLG